jgi:hypothetical protein
MEQSPCRREFRAWDLWEEGCDTFPESMAGKVCPINEKAWMAGVEKGVETKLKHLM